jgi:tol-pal system protein YbgF
MKRLAPLLVPLLLLAAGCTGLGLRPDDAQQQEIQALKARILELQREAAMNQVELAQLRQRVAEIEVRNGGPRTAASAPATRPRESRPAAEPPKSPPAPVRPAPAPETRREPAAAEEIEEVDLELPETAPPAPPRPASPPVTATPVPAPGRTPGSSATRPQAPTPADAVEPVEEPTAEVLSPANQVLYDRGYTLYHQGRLVDAEASFQRFLQANPGSELADNAQYWIGECRYARNDFKGALAAFRETVERFPRGNKVADAMLKAGQSLEALGDIEGARVTYREVARRFPGTLAAGAAEERRAKLP